jgi:A/G-specific adenine glycosylase
MKLHALVNWSKCEFYHLPWRKNRSLYGTLVSEIMLQQTTVATVNNHFERFLARFPQLQDLALATEDELLVAWKGLGYYRRARNLKKIAETIFQKFNGEFPAEINQLENIPGIGPYTASALVAIGMDLPALAVDANLERVIARLLGLKEEKGPKLQKKIRFLFEEKKIFNDHKLSFREINEALMDLGRSYCQASKTSCELCPLRNDCFAFKHKKQLKFPVQNNLTGKDKGHELHLLRVIVKKGNCVLAYKKDVHQWLSGQYELPTFVISSSDPKLSQYPILLKKMNLEGLLSYKTGITKYSITNTVLVTSEHELNSFGLNLRFEWKDFRDEKANLSTASLKALNKILITTGKS